MKIKKRTKSILVLVTILLGVAFLFLIAIAKPIPTTFNVAVVTERIEFITKDENIPRIPLNNTLAFNYNGDSLGIYNGSFQVSAKSQVIVERISYGALIILIENKSGNSAGAFYDAEQDQIIAKADKFVEFYISNPSQRAEKGENIIVPISGEVVLGRAVGYESSVYSPALVRNGKITMIGKSILGNHFFQSGIHELNIGEEFIVEKFKSKSFGFLVINEKPAMQATYKVVAKKGKIITPGPVDQKSGYFIATTLVSRFLNDSLFQAISSAFAFLLFISTCLTFVKDLEEISVRRKKKRRTK